MKLSVIGSKRKDGKYKIRMAYAGAPNMFGGFYPDTIFQVLKTPRQIADMLGKYSDETRSDILDAGINMLQLNIDLMVIEADDMHDAMLDDNIVNY